MIHDKCCCTLQILTLWPDKLPPAERERERGRGGKEQERDNSKEEHKKKKTERGQRYMYNVEEGEENYSHIKPAAHT